MYSTGTMTVDDLLAQHTKLRPDAPALLACAADGRTVTISYAKLNTETRRFADLLDQKGVARQEGVLILMRNGLESCIAMLGTMRANRIAIPVPTMSTAHELNYLIRHSGAALLVTSVEFLPLLEAADRVPAVLLAGLSGTAFSWADSGVAPYSAARPIAHEGAALVLYTSGSTAQPKGVVLSQEAILSAGLCNAWHQQLRPDDRHGVVLPMYHSNALFLQFWASICAGASVYFGARFDPQAYWDDMIDNGVSVSNVVATGISSLLGAKTPAAGQGMRLMMYGLTLDAAEIEQFERHFETPLVMVYGLTETAACGTRSPVSLDRKPDRIGLPMPGWEVRIIDENLDPVALGQQGEIWLRGPAMFSGYLHADTETAATMFEGGLRTGDVGHFDEDGFVVFVDRMKDLIKIKGRSVSPLEIEAAIRLHDGVAEVAVIGVPDPQTGERIVAFVVPGGDTSAADIAAHCRELLSYYKVPAEIHLRADLPKTSVGKIRKNELRKLNKETAIGTH